MKIPLSVRNAYDLQYEKNSRLKEHVDPLLRSLKKDRWHYESRIKSQESFALKLETGRFYPEEVEDFFACTLVVENQTKVTEAKGLIYDQFDPQYRKPKSDDFTHKSSDSFPFDDLRLYVKYRDKPNVQASGVTDIIFEVQIKTFLQHAWSIATHDLIYKSDKVSWAKARIAYQIKAMLEHAEISIEAAESLSNSGSLSKDDRNTKSTIEAISFVKSLWEGNELPEDTLRLGWNVVSLSKALKLSINDLRVILTKETAEGRGAKTLNLSPYCIIVQSIINQNPNKITAFLKSSFTDFRILIPREVDLQPEIESIQTDRLIRIE